MKLSKEKQAALDKALAPHVRRWLQTRQLVITGQLEHAERALQWFRIELNLIDEELKKLDELDAPK